MLLEVDKNFLHTQVLARGVIYALCRIPIPAAAATISFPILLSAAQLALQRPNPWASVQCAMHGLSLLRRLAGLSPSELAASRCEWMPAVWHCLLASPLSDSPVSPTSPTLVPQNGLPAMVRSHPLRKKKLPFPFLYRGTGSPQR